VSSGTGAGASTDRTVGSDHVTLSIAFPVPVGVGTGHATSSIVFPVPVDVGTGHATPSIVFPVPVGVGTGHVTLSIVFPVPVVDVGTGHVTLSIVFPVPVSGGHARRGTSRATTGRRRTTDRGSRAAETGNSFRLNGKSLS